MFENCIMLPTSGMSRKEWLSERRKGIGGSDAAAIVGLSQYATAYTVYLDKLGLLPEKEENEAMRQGRDLEEYVACRFTEQTGKRVSRVNFMATSKTYPFAIADIDRRVVGENAGLECKTTASISVRRFQNVDFPEEYYAQCVHYLAVTGADRWYLAVLVYGKGFFVFVLERDDAEASALMSAESDFWGNHVLLEQPPEVTGASPDSAALSSIYPDSENETLDISGVNYLFSVINTADQAIREAKQAKESAVNQIKELMKSAGCATCGPWKAVWKTQQRKTLDVDALREDHPEIDFDAYTRITKTRPFLIRAIEK